MDHFKGINDQERFNNDLLNESRKQTQLLEQIAQLLKQDKGNKNETTNRPQSTRGNKRNS